MKKRFFKRNYLRARALCTAAVASVLMAASNASAAIDWSGITELDTGDVDTAMGLIVVALVSMWGYRKVIKTLNRS